MSNTTNAIEQQLPGMPPVPEVVEPAMRVLTPKPVMRATADIRIEAVFRQMFQPEGGIINSIKDDMRLHGYNPAFPLSVWRRGDTLVVLDGHTRLCCAEQLKIESVPVIEFQFRTEDDAFQYALACQKNRRNLTQAAFIDFLRRQDVRKRADSLRQGRKSPVTPFGGTEGKTIAELAAETGKPRRTVERALKVIKEASPEVVAAVEKGEVTITAAAQSIKPPAPAKPKSPVTPKGVTEQAAPAVPAPAVPAPAASAPTPIPAFPTTVRDVYDRAIAHFGTERLHDLAERLEGFLELPPDEREEEIRKSRANILASFK